MRISDWSPDVCSSDLPGVLVSDESVGRGEPNFGQGALGIEKIELAELAFAIADPRDAGCLLSGCQSRPVGCPRVCSGIVCFRTQIGRASCRERVCQYV